VSFPDVPASQPFRLQIGWLAGQKVTTGWADGGFHPVSPIARDAMAALLYRLHPVLETPTITGDAKIGSTLAAKPGNWTPLGLQISYQWLRDGKPIAGATSAQYWLTGADAGHELSVQAIGTLGDFMLVSVSSKGVTIPEETATPSAAVDDFKNWALSSTNWNSTTPYGNPGIDYDGAYGAQCADIGIAWSQWIGRRVSFDGWDAENAYKPGWRVVGFSLGQAQAGDVVTRVGGKRHVIVIIGSPANGTVQDIEQNPNSPHLQRRPIATSGVVWRST
jgi:hypothetical protein